jgi:hypothetical protein
MGNEMKTETRAVLAGAYKASNPRSLLTHTAVIDEAGNVVSVACGRVKLDSLADTYAQDISLPPTCLRCAR